MNEEKQYLEIEVKFNADSIDRIKFKDIAKKLNPKHFIYAESPDIYYTKGEAEFIRYRMPMYNTLGRENDKRAELTLKKKHTVNNNIVRTEVNLRVDMNEPDLVNAFCVELGYKKNFVVYKMCDIYIYEDATLVYYTVEDEDGKYASFIEVEASEEANFTQEQGWEVVQKYEKFLLPLGITAQNRKKLSLFEMYVKNDK